MTTAGRIGLNLRPRLRPSALAVAGACRAAGRALGELLFPWRCLLCDEAGPGLAAPFCAPCRAGLLGLAATYQAGSCPRCASPVGPFADLRGGCAGCRRRPLGFDAAVALGPHEAPWRDFVLGLKRERGAYLAPALASLLVEARREVLAAVPADAPVVPIPQHWLRRLGKRYNQAEALAHALADATGREARDALRRVKPTPHLVGRGRQARALALRGAFAARRGVDVKGRTVLLVDDVLTTGATLGSAARALKRAGARRVVAVVVSREK